MSAVDVARCLFKLGLGAHVAAFAADGVDMADLQVCPQSKTLVVHRLGYSAFADAGYGGGRAA